MTVLLFNEINPGSFQILLNRYGIVVKHVASNETIPGSFWQPPEAGLVGNVLYVRDDTPIHSALHEACHYICMDKQRREKLDTDAGGDYEEENGVCYLQILLAEHIPEMGRERMLSDMDAWGYSFRLGSSKAWFQDDAEDAADWLAQHQLVDELQQPVFHLRQ
ncbi:MAG: hypothetical protein PVF35_03560 [Gammaproteobacteria bacterium]|jgi:hypothetical protein